MSDSITSASGPGPASPLLRPAPLVVSSGDPQGIGPEITAALCARMQASAPLDRPVVLVGGAPLIEAVERVQPLPCVAIGAELPVGFSLCPVEHPWPLADPPPSAAGGAAAFAVLEACGRLLDAHPGAALVTAPVSKEAIVASGVPFTGHTEWIAERYGVSTPVMLFAAGDLRVALATVHCPLAEVAGRLSVEGVLEKLRVTAAGLRERFGIPDPSIAVLGLNPHAGEGGLIGREEIEILVPALERAAAEGLRCTGPHGADAFFRGGKRPGEDAVLAMYHDQGLLPIKCLAFGKAVNVTLGLPIVRTSVDHGTAFDIAGRGIADAEALEGALRLADQLCAVAEARS